MKATVLAVTGRRVLRATAPGGRGRGSVRVELEDGTTAIATRRGDPARAETEAALLQVLGEDGAPVPRVLGFADGLLVQSDAGRERLSWRMARADASEAAALARGAVGALEQCRAAMEARPDLLDRLPGLGTRAGWAEEYAARPVFLSGDLGIAPPACDSEVLARAVSHGSERFTRWDARLGNAAVQPDGSVVWYDWDLFGRRAGVEDLAWLVADPEWALDLPATEAVLGEVPGLDAGRMALLRRMAVLVAADRVAVMRRAVAARGWADAEDDVIRRDRASTTPERLERFCARMAAFAQADELVAGFAPWFPAAAGAMRRVWPQL
ncbi:hypothetical protein [Jannaschia sp. W003]|uniref:hypothetical protein n=1 Tax=Jannaschia sp. W003 TaxID=2867012 RepID=UPI0021A39093|nr:hypothetical protein [Jannaschia sp. W003]UWQ20012.1 hypothetical protein K3554_08280 [Jannaschia sp. W003]